MDVRYQKMILAMLGGTKTSILVFFLTLLFSLPLGLLLCGGRMSRHKVLSAITNLFLLIIRGTPLMLQLLITYFGPLLLVNFLNTTYHLSIKLSYNRFIAAIIALVINYACYFAEIYRGGIESINKGQYEAAFVLGYTRMQTFFLIVIPQVVKRITPAMANEVITLVKDTALVSVIGVAELLMVAKERQAALFSFTPLLIAGVFYFVMNWLVSLAFSFLEKKLSYYR